MIMDIGGTIFLLGFITLAIVLTILAFKSRMSWIMFPVIAVWLVIWIWLDTKSMIDWDIFYILRVLAITMAVASAIMLWGIIAMGKKNTTPEPSEFDEWQKDMTDYQAEMNKYRNLRRRRNG